MPGGGIARRSEVGGRIERKLMILERKMKHVRSMLRRVPPWVFFIFSALFFLVGAMRFNHAGGQTMAEAGVMGAVAAVAIIVAFRA